LPDSWQFVTILPFRLAGTMQSATPSSPSPVRTGARPASPARGEAIRRSRKPNSEPVARSDSIPSPLAGEGQGEGFRPIQLHRSGLQPGWLQLTSVGRASPRGWALTSAREDARTTTAGPSCSRLAPLPRWAERPREAGGVASARGDARTTTAGRAGRVTGSVASVGRASPRGWALTPARGDARTTGLFAKGSDGRRMILQKQNRLKIKIKKRCNHLAFR